MWGKAGFVVYVLNNKNTVFECVAKERMRNWADDVIRRLLYFVLSVCFTSQCPHLIMRAS